MPESRPLTILCVSSYEKGQEFLRTCKSIGCRVLLLTVEKLRNADWPRESIDEIFFMPEELPVQDLINAVSFAARSQPIDRIVALDEFDMENVSALREHLRIPGMGLTTVRYFRDKLAMRARAQEVGIAVPQFVPVLNYDALREFMARVPAPWLLKPRSQASGIGMKKIHDPAELWPWLDQLGDKQSTYLLEQFVPGSVYHVDSVAAERQVVFAEAHAYGAPPLDTSHLGGVFTTRTLPRGSAEVNTLLDVNRKVLEELGILARCHACRILEGPLRWKDFIFSRLPRASAGPISRMSSKPRLASIYGASGRASKWEQGSSPIRLPKTRTDYAGVIVSLARQEHPDTSAYNDPEIIYRVDKIPSRWVHSQIVHGPAHRGTPSILLNEISSGFSGHAACSRKT